MPEQKSKLTHQQVQTVLNIVQPYLDQGYELKVFGSYARRDARKTSDLDLVLIGDKPLGFKSLSRLRDQFEYSELPFQVDVADWQTLSDRFKHHIRKDLCELQSLV